LKNLGAAFGLVLLSVVAMPQAAAAASINILGSDTGSLATASGTLTVNATTLTLNLTNTSPYSADITGLGFDLAFGDFNGNSSGLNGFTGTSTGGTFTFTDNSLGNVPSFSSAVLDFGYLTGNNISGGSTALGLAPGTSGTFTITGNFAGYTEEQLASSMYVRFQDVGTTGIGDVGRATINETPIPTSAVPEPASMVLLGTGLLAAARARRRKA